MRIIPLFAMILTLSYILGGASNPAIANILGQKSTKTYSADKLPRWSEIQQATLQARHSNPNRAAQQWNDFIQGLQKEPALRKMMRTNIFMNRFAYKQDNWLYDEADYWASPSEFFQNGGDCEDYAIAKYLTLRELGFAANKMKIAMVYDVYSGTDHAFLIVKHEGTEYVLDNREKMTVARYMKNRYKPHYAFNEETVWVYNSPVMVQKLRNEDGSITAGNR